MQPLWYRISEGLSNGGHRVGLDWANERAQKLFPTLMACVGSTGGLAAAHTAMEQSRTPKLKFMFLQRHA